MQSVNPKLAIYGRNLVCTRTDTVFFPSSHFSKGKVSLTNFPLKLYCVPMERFLYFLILVQPLETTNDIIIPAQTGHIIMLWQVVIGCQPSASQVNPVDLRFPQTVSWSDGGRGTRGLQDYSRPLALLAPNHWGQRMLTATSARLDFPLSLQSSP